MRPKELFDSIYSGDFIPWDRDVPDENLISIIENNLTTSCGILEIGCGTGTDSIWLAQNGFVVDAIDISSVAIETAQEKSEGIYNLQFINENFLTYIPVKDYNVVYDRGFLNQTSTGEERDSAISKIANLLTESGLWISFQLKPVGQLPHVDVFNTSTEIINSVSNYFNVLDIFVGNYYKEITTSTGIASYLAKTNGSYEMWCCLFQKK